MKDEPRDRKERGEIIGEPYVETLSRVEVSRGVTMMVVMIVRVIGKPGDRWVKYAYTHIG